MNISTISKNNINQVKSLNTSDVELNKLTNKPKDEVVTTYEFKPGISPEGMANSHIESLNEKDRREISDYLQAVRSDKDNGTFDISASIKNAPEAFNDLAVKLKLKPDNALEVITNRKKVDTYNPQSK